MAEVGGVRHLPEGNTLLLSEDDVVSLVRYLFEPQTAAWSPYPTPEKVGHHDVYMFEQAGMLGVSDRDEIVNGEAEWSPEYFTQQEPGAVPEPTSKIHTLPWKLDEDSDREIQRLWKERRNGASAR